MYNNLYNKLKTILKDISYLETIYNSNNIFNTDWFNIINLMEELGYKIINMYTFIKKKHIAQKYNLNFTNIFNMIKINFNRLSYIIVLLNILKVVKFISAFCVLVTPILNDILPYSCNVKVSVV